MKSSTNLRRARLLHLNLKNSMQTKTAHSSAYTLECHCATSPANNVGYVDGCERKRNAQNTILLSSYKKTDTKPVRHHANSNNTQKRTSRESETNFNVDFDKPCPNRGSMFRWTKCADVLTESFMKTMSRLLQPHYSSPNPPLQDARNTEEVSGFYTTVYVQYTETCFGDFGRVLPDYLEKLIHIDLL